MFELPSSGETTDPEWTPSGDPMPEREGIPSPITDPFPVGPTPEWSPETD